jgi:isopentenyl diphosphate isomerase/L-lactate dehydrogenase-like FMN-dependent dehydrogenase
LLPINLHDYERLAVDALDPAVHGYYAGGSEDERTLRENPLAWGRWHLRPRVLVDVSEISTATTVLGEEVSLPVLLGPAAFQRLAHPDGELASARAAAAAGTVFCLSTLANCAPAEVAAAAPAAPRWFQLYCYRDAAVTRALVEQAVAAGFGAVVVTVDAPVPAKRDRDIRNGFAIDPQTPVPSLAALLGGPAAGTATELFSLVSASVTWREVEQLVAEAGVPVVLKGLMTAEDAQLACEHGVAGVVVSNHGGRQLDGVAATADVLAEVVEAVAGRAEVYVDGGIRRGTDVVKALALGARAVLVARPYLWALAVGGEEGVRHAIELLREEVALALANLGCTSPAAVTRDHVAYRLGG